MAAPGNLRGCFLGFDEVEATLAVNGFATFSMSALNSGFCLRFLALDTRDVKTVYLDWGPVTAAGTVSLRVETVDATTGKPTGTLYDVNATVAVTPVAGFQAFTFATLPTTGLIAGNEYALVFLTTVLGVTQPIRYSASAGLSTLLPCTLLTATDGTTRTNFAEVNPSAPVATIIYEDNAEEPLGLPYASASTYAISGTRSAGTRFTLNGSVKVSGAMAILTRAANPPAADLRFRLLDSSDNVVANTTVTLDKDSLNTQMAGTRRVCFPFPATVTLPPGTYRAMLDLADHAGGSSYNLYTLSGGRSAACPAGRAQTDTTNVDGTPITWVNTPTAMAIVGLVLDDLVGGGAANRGIYTGGRL